MEKEKVSQQKKLSHGERKEYVSGRKKVSHNKSMKNLKAIVINKTIYTVLLL